MDSVAAGGVIYALVDPRRERKGEIRYIGKTSDFKKRKRNYLDMLRRGTAHSPALRRWFAKLSRVGLVPDFRILETCLFGIDAAEQAWIDKGKAKRWALLNCRDGGVGGRLSDEAKARIAAITTAKWADPEYVARWQQAHERRFGKPAASRHEREVRHQANVLAWQANMRKAADRKRERDAVHVPLTYKGRAFIPLTQGKWAIIDAEDAERAGQCEWAAQRKGRYWRAKRTVNRKPLMPGTELLNRFIMRAASGEMVVHNDGEQLNCRKGNLTTMKKTGGRPIGRACQRMINPTSLSA